MMEVIGKIWNSSDIGKIIMILSVLGMIWLVWKMTIEAIARLANALSRIAEAADHLVGRLVTLAIVIGLLAFFIYGAFFASGVKGLKASKEGKSVSVEVKEK